jgi:hypothetical protein
MQRRLLGEGIRGSRCARRVQPACPAQRQIPNYYLHKHHHHAQASFLLVAIWWERS